MTRSILRIALSLACLIGIGGVVSHAGAQDTPPTWMSTVIWAPTLSEAGAALADHLNQIDASCTVDVENVQSTNGAGPEGAVYAFLVTWSCSSSNPNPAGLTWQSTIIWGPTLSEAGTALAEHLNQTDATCRVDTDSIQSTNGAGPEGPVYAFLVTWAC